jgi:Pyruvate/2-oxoacid:ferredoxin oxidoreductase delta subunit
MATRNIIEIDEEKCDGCGNCVIACAEGALEIRDGKAKIIKEIYCDGLGACVGDCPQDALRVVMKKAEPFDEEAMEEHLKTLRERQSEERRASDAAGCPGGKLVSFQQRVSAEETQEGDAPASELRNWPVQIHLLPVDAPFFDRADLLVAADCVPFAMGGFHQRLLNGKILAIGCPKLDNTEAYLDKLAQIFANNDIQSITIGYMEVPCCAGLLHVVHKALEASGKAIPVNTVKVSVQGQELPQERQGEDSRVESQS